MEASMGTNSQPAIVLGWFGTLAFIIGGPVLVAGYIGFNDYKKSIEVKEESLKLKIISSTIEQSDLEIKTLNQEAFIASRQKGEVYIPSKKLPIAETVEVIEEAIPETLKVVSKDLTVEFNSECELLNIDELETAGWTEEKLMMASEKCFLQIKKT